MRLLRPMLAALGLCLLGPALLSAQDPPLAAGSEGVPVPKKKKHVQPVYPQEALAQGIRGIVILDLVIGEDGRVAEVNIIRSIPGLDEAAVAAASQWEYEPPKVNSRPASVHLTVPITFALKLPDLTKQEGIPDLRQGVTPGWPENEQAGGRATADVTLEPDGRIGLARILEGDEPWSSALLQALRTWRFAAPPEDAIVSFRVDAEFVRGRGGDAARVTLRLHGLRQSQTFAPPSSEPTELASLVPSEEPDTGAGGSEPTAAIAEPGGETSPDASTEEETAPREAEAPEAPTEADALEPAAEPTPTEEPEPAEEGPSPTGETRVAQATPPLAPPLAAPAPAAAGPAAGDVDVEPATSAPEAGTAPVPGEALAQADPTAPPPIEVLTAPAPPLPPENGVSALRDVTLEPGVPDLTLGRRPVSPPFARMAGASGEVEVDFSVGSAGATTVREVRGPEILRAAAREAVETWTFRRTRADRLYLTAVFTYDGDGASAVVRPQALP